MESLYISSAKNPRIQAASLLRDSKHRKRTSQFLIDGWKLIKIALRHGIRLDEIYLKDGSDSTAAVNSIHAVQPDAEIMVVSPHAMQKLQYGEQAHDVIAVAQQADLRLATMDARQNSNTSHDGSKTYLVLDQMEKPGNLGAALRTADAVGVSGVLLCDPICDPWNPNSVRASLGALFTVPLAIGTELEILNWLTQRNVAIFPARVEGAKDYRTIKFPVSVALVVGNEAHGLSHRWSSPSLESIYIPMAGSLDSLNASVSTAVLLFEISRQRNEINQLSSGTP